MKKEARTYCKQRVFNGGRADVGWHPCTRPAGYGPGGEFCRYHAKRHETATPTITLWEVKQAFFDLDDPLPGSILVREVSEKTFIDARGRRHPLRDRYHAYYATEGEALAATKEHVTGVLEEAERSLAVAKHARAVVNSRDRMLSLERKKVAS